MGGEKTEYAGCPFHPPPTPYPLAGLFAIAIAVGGPHTCAIAAGGGVKCWGANGNGQLGIGSYEDQNRPADVTGAARGQLKLF
jgi:alpha-tubulin suppressor-like RCC1 family protein